MTLDLAGIKQNRLRKLSTPAGVIAALAMDQRKSLRKMIARAAKQSPEAIPDSALREFKSAVTSVLTPFASAILLDPEYGMAAAHLRSRECGLLVTYEADGYENPRPHRMLALMPHYSARRLHEAGADAIKILLSYAPDDDAAANDEKKAMIERIGHECEGCGLPFLLEPVVYDPEGSDPFGFEFAVRKPEWVVRTMEEFARPMYRVDVLKVEFPVNARYVEGSEVAGGRSAYSKREAMNWFVAADQAARQPYIYLSAGISSAEFVSSLELAAEAGARFSGVLCGRANWQDGIAHYANGGIQALMHWLSEQGVRNMQRVNECLKAATPWTQWIASETKDRA